MTSIVYYFSSSQAILKLSQSARGHFKELEHATFFSHKWKLEVNMLHARTLVSTRFSVFSLSGGNR